jgi:hypothetical protein
VFGIAGRPMRGVRAATDPTERVADRLELPPGRAAQAPSSSDPFR